jgi:hypothetical protein
MKATIDKTIETLMECITKKTTSTDALKYTQSALNLAHTKSVLANIEEKDNSNENS